MTGVHYINDWCPLYQWLVSTISMTGVHYINDWCPLYQWLVSTFCMTAVFYINESCHLWMNRVMHQWLMSCIDDSCHVSMNDVAYICMTAVCISMNRVCYEWIASCINDSCHVSMIDVTYISMTHVMIAWIVSCMNDPCHAYVVYHLSKRSTRQAAQEWTNPTSNATNLFNARFLVFNTKNAAYKTLVILLVQLFSLYSGTLPVVQWGTLPVPPSEPHARQSL